jgi:hypothetical protein
MSNNPGNKINQILKNNETLPSTKLEEMSAKLSEMYFKETEISKDVNNLKNIIAGVGFAISILVLKVRIFLLFPFPKTEKNHKQRIKNKYIFSIFLFPPILYLRKILFIYISTIFYITTFEQVSS